MHRWIENLASPATKLLVPFLCAILGIFFFSLLQQLEAQLTEQLNRADLRTIRTQETLFAEVAQQRLANGLEEDHVWKEYCSRYEVFQQAPTLASSSRLPRIQVLTFATAPSFFPIPPTKVGEPREAILLTNVPYVGKMETIRLLDHDFTLPTAPLPKELAEQMQVSGVAVFPIEYFEELMKRGFTQIQILTPKPEVSTEQLENLIRSHAHAENRNLRVETLRSVLAGLNELLTQQKQARLAIGALVTVILSLILGSLSLLEFRQEGYLIALLRSFGIKPLTLLLHYVLETLFLTFAGIFLAIFLFPRVAPIIASKLQQSFPEQNLQFDTLLDSNDYQTLFFAAGLGVLISAIPIAVGLRKQPGLLLP